MNSIKSTAVRSLRYTTGPIAHGTEFSRVATRGIAGTHRKSTAIEKRTPSPQSTPFIPKGTYLPKLPPFHSSPSPKSKYPDINPTPEFRRTTTPFSNPTSTTNDFTHLLTSITSSLTANPTANLPHLTSLLRAYTSDPTHWSPYAHANASKQYTRNLVHSVPGLFNLLLLVWTPGKASPVHDHADAHCLMKIMRGSLVERRFEIPGKEEGRGQVEGGREMREYQKAEYGMGKVAYMADCLGLHEISNPSPVEYAVSLHLYTPPNAATRGCMVYDLENGEASRVMQGKWDSVGGVPT